MNLRGLVRAVVSLMLIAVPALATSTIDPTQPLTSMPYSSAPIRNNFQAAYNDINALQNCNRGSVAPSSPNSGYCWLDTSAAPTWAYRLYDSITSTWVLLFTINSTTGVVVPATLTPAQIVAALGAIQVANTAALRLSCLSSATCPAGDNAFPSGVWRATDGAAGAPPLFYIPDVNSVCAADDGGYCVAGAGGGYWIAQPRDKAMDVREWGCQAGGVTDAGSCLNTAGTSAAAYGVGLRYPALTFRAAETVVIPAGVPSVVGQAYPGNPPTGSTIVCDLAVTPCVQTNGTGSTGPGSISGLIASRAAGSFSNAAEGILVNGGYNLHLSHLVSWRQGNGFHWSVGACAGIGLTTDHLYTGAISGNHVVMDGWPEWTDSDSRYGTNGSSAVSGATAYIEITGGVNGSSCAGTGPNTMKLTGDQFNTTTMEVPAHWLNFTNNTTGGNTSTVYSSEFSAFNSHVENVGASVIASDNTWVVLHSFILKGNTFNTVAPFWALNAATNVYHSHLSGNVIGCTSFNLSPTGATLYDLTISDNSIVCNSSFSNNAGVGVLTLSGNDFNGNLTIGGSAQWDALTLSGGEVTGTFTNSTAAGTRLSNTIPGVSSMPCSLTPAFAGGSGWELTTNNCSYQQVGDTVRLTFADIFSSLGSASGTFTLTGVPVPPTSMNIPTCIVYFLNGTGVSGPVSANITNGAPGTINFTVGGTSGSSSSNLSAAQMTNTSNLECNLQYTY